MKATIKPDQYKLIISDIDGTIKCSGQGISAFTRKVIDKIRDRGLLFTLASGRSLPGAMEIAEELKIDIPLVLSNGCILQKITGEILHRALMPSAITKKIFEITDQLNYDLVLFVDGQLYFKKMTDNIKPVFGRISDACHQVGDWKNLKIKLETVNKCMVLERSSSEKLAALENIFGEEFSGKADHYRTGIYHLEVMPVGVSKAVGLQKLVDLLGLKMEQVIAIGDYDNDAALLSAAGLGIAVANATDKVKNNADLVIGPCVEDAPAKLLSELFLQ
jgi:Cof subfamily protein (haloacid dehalogenase superfamily)